MQCVIYTREAGRYEPGPLVSIRRDEITVIRYNLYGSELFLRHDDKGDAICDGSVCVCPLKSELLTVTFQDISQLADLWRSQTIGDTLSQRGPGPDYTKSIDILHQPNFNLWQRYCPLRTVFRLLYEQIG